MRGMGMEVVNVPKVAKSKLFWMVWGMIYNSWAFGIEWTSLLSTIASRSKIKKYQVIDRWADCKTSLNQGLTNIQQKPSGEAEAAGWSSQ